MSPSFQPTGQPSQQPSISYETLWGSKVPGWLINVSSNISQNDSDVSISSFTELYTRGRMLNPYGGIDQWNTFVAGTIPIKFASSQNATVVHLSSFDSFHTDTAASSYECRGGAAYLISTILASPPLSSTSVSCAGNNWIVKTCRDSSGDATSPSLCVNCTDPCSFSECNDLGVISLATCRSMAHVLAIRAIWVSTGCC